MINEAGRSVSGHSLATKERRACEWQVYRGELAMQGRLRFTSLNPNVVRQLIGNWLLSGGWINARLCFISKVLTMRRTANVLVTGLPLGVSAVSKYRDTRPRKAPRGTTLLYSGVSNISWQMAGPCILKSDSLRPDSWCDNR